MMSTALLWAIAERVVVIHTDVSGRPIAPFFRGQGLLTVEFRGVLDVPRCQYEITAIRCVITQKSAILVCFGTEVRIHAEQFVCN